MRDYKELVERLHKRMALTTAGSPLQNDLLEAADAIKALLISAQLETPPYVAEIESEYEKWGGRAGKEGRWEPVTNGRGGHECSICHSYAPSYKNGEEHLSPYCPNCGAKMEERREDGDGDG